MQNDFHFDQYPLSLVLDRLLMDKTTGDHILWATDRYEKYGQIYDALFEILPQTLLDINRVKIGPKALGRLTDPGTNSIRPKRSRSGRSTACSICRMKSGLSALMYSTPKPSAPGFPVPIAWILGKSAGTNTWNVPFWSRRVRKLNFS